MFGVSTGYYKYTVFSLGDYEGSNYNDSDYVAYCYRKRGYSKFGTYDRKWILSWEIYLYRI